ncbi:hypothetical protein GQS_01465 [Thermococcus sp. 4557]|uniref:hypothetical protein n=1 Tax=Thermococcus sp. (strain CGMCC 1.5172 / 4557) TaxID=1042877 RepID=UPI000219EBB3|nr:hypothetical protein [Thermococcus sp. 4557]AEK72195.1 hypothetical protein GQS_01465 [Thermococcus sp. 4557]
MADQKKNPGDEEEEKIRDVLPWGKSNFLSDVIAERKRERSEAIEIVENLVDPNGLPDEVKPIIKKPDKKELIGE